MNPFVLGAGLTQTLVADETQFLMDSPDMQTFNETGPQAYRYLFRVHEIGANGGVSVTDLQTGSTQVLIQRADWERLDPITWTPWGTLLFGEEAGPAALPDPNVPSALKGLVYELNPRTLAVSARPMLGSKAHEGTDIDSKGNVYGISEISTGAIYKFVPSTTGDLSAGQLYALQITNPVGDRTGTATWLPLDMNQAVIDADVAAANVGATGYGRPEDIVVAGEAGTEALYVAVTSEARVLKITLGTTPVVSEYIKAGVNAPSDFSWPDNLDVDAAGHLFITEDPGGSFAGGKTAGDDIWVSSPGAGGNVTAAKVVRLASLTDCDAEPTGLKLDKNNQNLYVHVQHRGGNGIDMDMKISRAGGLVSR
ncbi:MAG: DUF839 domain-containing protein [Gemmatimonadaceae bacterium]